jgi:hypothetical protein
MDPEKRIRDIRTGLELDAKSYMTEVSSDK